MFFFFLKGMVRAFTHLAVGLDSNFRQDVGICHFHGYWVGAFFSSVSVKLENVCSCLLLLFSVWGYGVRGTLVGTCGVCLEVNRDIGGVEMKMTHGQFFVSFQVRSVPDTAVFMTYKTDTV